MTLGDFVFNNLPYRLLKPMYKQYVKITKKQTFNRIVKSLISSDEKVYSEYGHLIRKAGYIRPFYGDWFKEKTEITVPILWSKDNKCFYTEYKNHFEKTHNMFFSPDMKKSACQMYLDTLVTEQDSKSPHCYFSEKVLKKILTGGIVLDLGVAEGNFVLETIDYADKVICFEPEIKWQKALEFTCKSFKNKVEIVKKYVSDSSNNLNTISVDEYFGDNIPDNISIIKMDIEGYEQAALRGMRRTLEKNPSTILLVCAYHTQCAEKEIREIVEPMGYYVNPRKGYMLMPSNDMEWPYLRRGVLEIYKC